MDGENWTVWKDSRGDDTDLTHDLIVLEQPTACRYVRLRGMQTAMGGVPAVSGLRVFGKGDGLPPARVEHLSTNREGALNILLRWETAEGATGYNNCKAFGRAARYRTPFSRFTCASHLPVRSVTI